jgi:hypothetical protein
VPQYVSPFITSFQVDALADGDTDGALALLRRTWTRMLRGDTTGTFWENVSTSGGPQLGSYTSYSHGWAAAPTTFLTTRVLGVEPTGPGFSSFSVTPHPGSRLEWAQGAVPTPRGTITAAWKRSGTRFELSVEAPPGATYTAAVPAAPLVKRDGRVVYRDGAPQAAGVTAAGGYVQIAGLTGTTQLEADR